MDSGKPRKRVLILCTGNSCRSQMSEGIWRSLGGKDWEVFSAGSEPAGFVHLLAVETMREVNIDISPQSSKHMNAFLDQSFDLIVTVCDSAQQACPSFSGSGIRVHWPFTDPARVGGDNESQRQAFQTVRDQIMLKINSFLTQA